MNYDRKSPCISCPYRKDAKLAFWNADHFTKLLQDDADTMRGALYQCHEDGKKPDKERGFCIGWLLTQRENGTRSIQLRLKLFSDPKAVLLYESIESKVPLYPNVLKMCEANLKAMKKPRRRKTK